MEIRSLNPIANGPRGLDALASTAAPPALETVPAPAESKPLGSAVTIDIGTDGREARFVRDTGTDAMVFQVVDPGSGDVVAQSPTESALRNRAYLAAQAQRASNTSLSRLA